MDEDKTIVISDKKNKGPNFYLEFLLEKYWLVKAYAVDDLLKPLLNIIVNFDSNSDSQLLSITVTDKELSIIVREDMLEKIKSTEIFQKGLIPICGPYYCVTVDTDDPGRDEPGVLAKITTMFAEQGLSILCISTYNCNYILFPQDQRDILDQMIVETNHHISSD